MKQKFNIKTFLHTIVFAYIYLMISLIVPTNFTVTAPNETRSANTMIKIEGIDQTEHLKSVSVLSMDRITGFARMIYEISPLFDVEKLGYVASTLTNQENNLRGQIQKMASFDQAIISAYTLASQKNNQIQIDYDFIGMTIDYRDISYPELKIGDIITDINNIGFTDYETLGMYFINNFGTFELDVLRNNEKIRITIDKETDKIFRFYPKYNITSATPKYSLPGEFVFMGGPSAGMMYTLSVYFALVKDIEINLDVVGTGTIRYNNDIGEIGGLKQKVYGAYHEGIKHFLLPASQYNEVKDEKLNINLYPVNNINEAIEVIYEIFS
ncbi:S16 family serine protease [Acholeplasma granularum]|uniref:S16 family serine protease n=1 Tax=Acholeplasma granularum TaxID=264635 RepID=UPI000471AE8F|nr:S16 family serine protease [Acholeplasma granularum]